jgi:creatinine amidohydrolase
MAWPEVKKMLENPTYALLPVGSTEQHGPHLPLDNDHFTAYSISELAAERMQGMVSVVVCPPIPFGISPHHMDFPGTISLRTKTFIDVVEDSVRSLLQHGFMGVIVVNGHGGNMSALGTILVDMQIEHRDNVFVANWWEFAEKQVKETCGLPLSHACEAETSIALALNQRVQMENARGVIVNETVAQKHRYPRIIELTETGSMGEPQKATKEKGEVIVDAGVRGLCELLESLYQKQA